MGIIYMTSVHQSVVVTQSNNPQDVAFSEVKYIVPFIVIYYSRLVLYLFQTYSGFVPDLTRVPQTLGRTGKLHLPSIMRIARTVIPKTMEQYQRH